ncbi:hypothetical protein CRYUN_Cryun10bG0094100 [Craigia yunnanensis]
MSLSLLQGYSSAEEEEAAAEHEQIHYRDSSSDDEDGDVGVKNHSAAPKRYDSSVFNFPDPSPPPEFLNHVVEEQISARDLDHQQGRRGGRRDFKDKKDMPAAVPSTKQDGAKRVASATNPNAEDAAEVLRMCLQCGIPKTYSSARGMVCPVCGDRPLANTDNDPKKKGSIIKEKEKSKRMKGQSSHATWKSEREMQLRQQFDWLNIAALHLGKC